MTDLPLLAVFDGLRAEGVPLGLDEYMLLPAALNAGYGLPDRAALERLCAVLWTKTAEERRILQRLMDRALQPNASRVAATTRLGSRLGDGSTVEATGAGVRPPSRAGPAETMRPGSNVSLPAHVTLEIEEPTQIVQAIQHAAARDGPDRLRFALRAEYLPVTYRQMKQCWRNLRRTLRTGPATELDVPRTVDAVGRQGWLLDAVLMPARSNQAELLLLVDQGGSMTPFHPWTRQLVETAQRGGGLHAASAYYFHDCPEAFVYRHPARRKAESLERVLQAAGDRTAVLIVSDAGAARGGFDPERVARTAEFVNQVKEATRYSAWLNPMPSSRWPSTSASAIARVVPMFEMTRAGLYAAVGALRGRYVYRAPVRA